MYSAFCPDFLPEAFSSESTKRLIIVSRALFHCPDVFHKSLTIQPPSDICFFDVASNRKTPINVHYSYKYFFYSSVRPIQCVVFFQIPVSSVCFYLLYLHHQCCIQKSPKVSYSCFSFSRKTYYCSIFPFSEHSLKLLIFITQIILIYNLYFFLLLLSLIFGIGFHRFSSSPSAYLNLLKLL